MVAPGLLSPLVLALSLELSLGCVHQPHPEEGLSFLSSFRSPILKPQRLSDREGLSLEGGKRRVWEASQNPFQRATGDVAKSAPMRMHPIQASVCVCASYIHTQKLELILQRLCLIPPASVELMIDKGVFTAGG